MHVGYYKNLLVLLLVDIDGVDVTPFVQSTNRFNLALVWIFRL